MFSGMISRYRMELSRMNLYRPRESVCGSTPLLRVVISLCTTRWGWIVTGIGLLIGGHAINNWLYGSLLMGTGVLFIGITLFLLISGRKRLQRARAAELAELEARPSVFARELGQSSQNLMPTLKFSAGTSQYENYALMTGETEGWPSHAA